ncbi:DUF4153 domain-containing protein [Lutibaculum baratangense]|uniref:DUF4153 domain-containing protein n=1 Tax=Lutibaculum baratangense AMV1 TaxID=631454 RepID=V4RL28_9HYPH|nr:DUF4153 domain-containing protein [Lutibaculum baratangense]ESR23915.1 hypothetical protein N177_2860 [Lutibaculum baratangense AMV1]
MTTPPRTSFLASLLSPDLGRGLRRFPLPCLFATLLAVLVSLDQFDSALLSGADERIFSVLVAAGLAALGADLLSEGRSWQGTRRMVADGLAVLAVATLFLLPLPYGAFTPGLIAGLLVFVGVAGFVGPQSSLDRFWRFNENVWVSAGIAVLAAGAFAIGIFAIERSLDILFGIDFQEIVTNVVFPFSFCLLAPLMWLASIPRLGETSELEPDRFLDRAVRLLARFILVPLLTTYTVILFAYTVQILLLWRLPEGQVGWMVSAFGVAGALTVLLLYPERNHGGRFVQFFTRWWFAATIVPVVLLAFAAYVRISEYGLTPPRYALVLIAIWLGAMALLFARPRFERDVRLIPGILAVLVVLGSFGPWGGMAMSARSQADEFVTLARQSGWADGRTLDEAALRAAASATRLRGDDSPVWRARSILNQIAELEGIDMLAARFDNPEALTVIVGPGRNLREAFSGELGIDADALPARPRGIVASGDPSPFDLTGYAVAIGPTSLPEQPQPAGAGRLSGGSFEARLPSGALLSADLTPLVDASASETDPVSIPSFFKVPGPAGDDIGVMIVEIGGLWSEGRLELHALKLVLFLPESEAGSR